MSKNLTIDPKPDAIFGQLSTQRCLKLLSQFLFHPEQRLKNGSSRTYKQRQATADLQSMNKMPSLLLHLIERSNYSQSRYAILSSRTIEHKPISAGIDFDIVKLNEDGLVSEALKSWLNRILRSNTNHRLFFLSYTEADFVHIARIIDKLPKSKNFDIIHIFEETTSETHKSKPDIRVINGAPSTLGSDIISFNTVSDISKRSRKEWIEALGLERMTASEILKNKTAYLQLAFSLEPSGSIKGYWQFTA